MCTLFSQYHSVFYLVQPYPSRLSLSSLQQLPGDAIVSGDKVKPQELPCLCSCRTGCWGPTVLLVVCHTCIYLVVRVGDFQDP